MVTKEVKDDLDPLQFAYKEHRGVEDATLTLLHCVTQHLETKMGYVRILFVDFSSAFNTMQPFLLFTETNVS